MKKLIATLLGLAVLGWTPLATAEDGVLEFWRCTLKDGKTMEDAARVNAKWLKFQNAANPDAGIRSWALTPIVADDLGGFGYMDAFPSLDAWQQSRTTIETPEGQALDAELNDIASCSMNRLFKATEH